jgi:hypothetical protein
MNRGRKLSETTDMSLMRMLVAAPLLNASAIRATGRDDVKYSEARPMRTPDTMSTVTAVPAFTRQERGVTTMDGKSNLEDCLVIEWMADDGLRQNNDEQEPEE